MCIYIYIYIFLFFFFLGGGGGVVDIQKTNLPHGSLNVLDP